MAPHRHKIAEKYSTVINPIVKSAFIIGLVRNVGFVKSLFTITTGINIVKIAPNNAMLVDCPTTRIVERTPAAIP